MTSPTPPTILVVHADDAIRSALAAHLFEVGYLDVKTTSTGIDAWYIIKNFDVRVIVSTWSLPDMTGLVLLKIIRADPSFAKIPYLMIMDAVNRTQVIEAGEAGVTDIIIGPLNGGIVKKRIDQALHIEDDPGTAEFKARYDKGLELMNAGRYEEALVAFKGLLDIYESAEIYYNVGYIRTAQGRYEEALLAFRRATQINNAHAMAFQKMGEVYAKMGRYAESQQCFQQAAEIYLEKQMDQSAEEVLLEAIKANPGTINVYNTLGIVYRRQGKYQEAIRYYRKALRVTPNDENILFNLARVYMAVKNFTEAGRNLASAIEINPNFTEARRLYDSIQMGSALS